MSKAYLRSLLSDDDDDGRPPVAKKSKKVVDGLAGLEAELAREKKGSFLSAMAGRRRQVASPPPNKPQEKFYEHVVARRKKRSSEESSSMRDEESPPTRDESAPRPPAVPREWNSDDDREFDEMRKTERREVKQKAPKKIRKATKQNNEKGTKQRAQNASKHSTETTAKTRSRSESESSSNWSLEDDEPFPIIENARFDDSTTTPIRMDVDDMVGEIPASVARYLLDYQKAGVKWLFRQYALGIGGILADDMGLGKTVQAVALVAALIGLKGSRKIDGNRKRERAKRAKLSERRAAERARRIVAGRNGDTDDEEEECVGPAVVCVKATTQRDWLDTFEKWTICNVAAIKQGQSSTERHRILRLAKYGGYDAIVVTTDLVQTLEWEHGPSEYLVAVIDEVHEKFRNPKTQASANILPLKERARCMFGLTGTPLSNDAFNEAHTLLSLCTNAKLADKKDFCEDFRAIEAGRKKHASRNAVILGRAKADEFKKLIETYCLRRTKEVELRDVLTEGKNVMTITLDLSPLQKRLYNAVYNFEDVTLLRKAFDLCDCETGRRDKLKYIKCCGMQLLNSWKDLGIDDYRNMDDRERSKGQFFAATCHNGKGVCKNCPHYAFAVLSKLTKIANHPSLLQLDPGERDEDKIERTRLFAELVFGKEDLMDRGLVRSNMFLEKCRTDECEKLRAVELLLEQFSEREVDAKVIIFSRFTKMLDIIQAFIISRQYTYVRLDGNTPAKDRPVIMRQFNDLEQGVFVALVSTMAGGAGVNLQGANKVIIFDVNWNPASDAQAQDRSYRIGQKRAVTVFRLVSKGTVEELAYMRQIYKIKTNNAGFDGAIGSERGMKFSAVKGHIKGELFGVGNLLKYSETSFIESVTKKDKKRKKTSVAKGLDVFDNKELAEDVDENALMDVMGESLFTSLLFTFFSQASRQLEVMSTSRVSTRRTVKTREGNRNLTQPTRRERTKKNARQNRSPRSPRRQKSCHWKSGDKILAW